MLLLNETEIIEKSLNAGVNMKFSEFIKFNNIDLDSVKVDKFFHNLDNNIPIYMDETIISYFVYSGNLLKQKQSIKNLFETNFLEQQNQLWHIYNNKDYKKYLENLEYEQRYTKNLEKNPEKKIGKLDIQSLYPSVPTGKGTSTTKHTLVMPKLFKEALMLCQTEKGKLVRRFYIEMLDVFNLYIQFQNKMKINSLEGKLDVMILKLDESNKISEERNKKLDESNKISEERNKKLEESEKKREESEKKREESERKREESERKAEIERQKSELERQKAD